MGSTDQAYSPQQLANIIAAVRDPAKLSDIGPYRIEELIGEGGMGQVYRAQQLEPIQRTVAIKVIKLGMDTRQVIARFDAERQTLAMMDHPNVATVLDAGATDNGRPYFVMEYVNGEPITTFADREKLTVRQRLELFTQACEAVQHAHQKAIIHRDLKPSNILVTLKEGKPWVKVIDFGVAKAVDQRATEKTLFTEAGQLVGTPEYMAPEQADGKGLDVDTRTDVYALGVVLYELLVGVLPFDASSLRSAAYNEIQRIIRDVDPPRLSTRLSGLGETAQTTAQLRCTPLAILHQQLKRELEWIPLKAMRKERVQRYSSARELAEDIANYLSQRPLRAGPESRAYRARKFLRRNKAAVAASVAMLALLLCGIAATSWQAVRATRAEGRAVGEKQEADRQRQAAVTASENVNEVNLFLTELLAAAAPEVTRGKPMTVEEAVNRAAELIPKRFIGRPLSEGAVREALAETYSALGDSNRALTHVQAARDLYLRQYGPDDRISIVATLNVGRTLDQLNRHGEAEPLIRDALDRSTRLFGGDHEITMRCMGGLAQSLRMQERLAEAEPLYRAVLEARRRNPGADRERLAEALNNLAVLLNTQKRPADAEPLYREALTIRKTTLGTDHPAYLGTMSNLARVLQDQGRTAEAVQMARDVLATKRRVLKDDHPSTTLSIHALASLVADLGQFDEAIALLREALERRSRTLGAKDPETLQSLHNLAQTCARAGRNDEAATYFRQAIVGREQTLGKTHPYTVNSLNGLSRVYESQARYAELEPLLLTICEPDRLAAMPGQAPRAAVFARLGRCRVQLGRPADAEAPYRRAYELLQALDSPPAGVKQQLLTEMADLYDRLNRADEAARLRRELAAFQASTQPASQPAKP